MLAVLRSDRNGKHSTFSLVHGTLHPIHANPLEVIVLLSLYLAVLDDQSKEEQFIDGTYRDLAGLASVVAGALSLPAAPALAISKTALAYFGFAMTAVQFTIPQCNLNSQYEQIEYTLTDINYSSHKNSFWGTKYVITESGNKFNNTYTDGEYYPTTSWGNQNFGMTIYNYLFTYSNWNIYA